MLISRKPQWGVPAAAMAAALLVAGCGSSTTGTTSDAATPSKPVAPTEQEKADAAKPVAPNEQEKADAAKPVAPNEQEKADAAKPVAPNEQEKADAAKPVAPNEQEKADATAVLSSDSFVSISSPPANQLIAAATAADDVTKKVAEEIASAAAATPSLGSVHQSTAAPDARRKKIGVLSSRHYKNNVVFYAKDGNGNFFHDSITDGTVVNAPIDGWNGVEWKNKDDTGTLRVRGYGTERGVMPLFALGYWLHVPDDATSADSYEVGVFALGGGGGFNTGHLSGLTGTATYEGDAVGLYAKRAAVEDTPDIKEFTADVALTADFGANTELGSVSGTVSNFNVGGMEKALKLSLGSATITGTRYGGFFKGGDTSAAGGFSGKWAGAFYGDGQATTDKPASIVGTFGAAKSDKLESFIGAFGPKKQ